MPPRVRGRKTRIAAGFQGICVYVFLDPSEVGSDVSIKLAAVVVGVVEGTPRTRGKISVRLLQPRSQSGIVIATQGHDCEAASPRSRANVDHRLLLSTSGTSP